MRVLIVDDNPNDAELLKKLLKRRFDANVFIAESMKQAREIVAANNLDCIVLDLNLKDSEIEETVNAIRSLPYPTFVYTGYDDPDLRQRVLDNGAEDFITKATEKSGIIERIGHLQYKRKGGKDLLKAAYQARQAVPREAARKEWLGTIPRAVAAVVSVVMFASGALLGGWNTARGQGVQAEAQKQHFGKLDEAIVEFRDARREERASNMQRDTRILELERKAQASIDDRQSIRELDKQMYDQVLERLRNIENLLGQRK